ncbi:MAG: GNAT family N-acetyltransferase [Christensenellales bacterium]|jgi:predicted GNAT family N-acyltransferase
MAKLSVSGDFEDCKKIREEVFIKEQGIDYELEFDEIDEYATHMALCCDDRPIGCGRVYETDENIFRLGRIAIIKEFRRKGYGRYLLGEMEKKAIELGARHLVILGNIDHKDFYYKLGYKEIGDIVVEDIYSEIYYRKTIK